MRYVHLALGALILLAVTAPLRGQMVSTPIPLLPGEQVVPMAQLPMRGAYAVTGCVDGQPLTQYAAEHFLSQGEAAELATHERVHRRHMTPDAHQTCQQKYDSLNATIEATVHEEAEAYCAQIHFDALFAKGADESDITEYITRALFEYFGRRISTEHLRKEFALFGCTYFTPEEKGNPK